MHRLWQRWQSLLCHLVKDRYFYAVLMLSSYMHKTKIVIKYMSIAVKFWFLRKKITSTHHISAQLNPFLSCHSHFLS